jgi:hypothetical protein
VGKRESERYTKLLAQLSREYGLPSSQMSLVAVVKRAGDVAGEIPKTQVVPVGLPQDMQFEGVFGAPAAGAPRGVLSSPAPARPALRRMISREVTISGRPSNVVGSGKEALSAFLSKNQAANEKPATPEGSIDMKAPQTPDDLLIVLAGMLEPDGGMPGKNEQQRIVSSEAALVFFVAQGNTRNSGPFRVHVDKLLRFLTPERMRKLDASYANLAAGVLEAIGKGRAPKGDWEKYARELAARQEVDQDAFWQDISAPVA